MGSVEECETIPKRSQVHSFLQFPSIKFFEIFFFFDLAANFLQISNQFEENWHNLNFFIQFKILKIFIFDLAAFTTLSKLLTLFKYKIEQNKIDKTYFSSLSYIFLNSLIFDLAANAPLSKPNFFQISNWSKKNWENLYFLFN